MQPSAMLNLKLSIAQNESDQTSDRIKFVFENKVKNGEIIAGMKAIAPDIVSKKIIEMLAAETT